MAELTQTLTAASPLGGYARSWPGVRLSERTGLAIVSLAVPMGAETALAKSVKSAWGIALPDPRQTSLSKDGEMRLVRTTPDQMLALFEHDSPDAEPTVRAKLSGAAYTTDQTDVWVALELSGPGARTTLERLCPLDLHPETFDVGVAARTVMEHIGAIVLREDDDSYLLLSASSSARSFLHAVETSIDNTH